jgi:hypothetical protein
MPLQFKHNDGAKANARNRSKQHKLKPRWNKKTPFKDLKVCRRKGTDCLEAA